MGKARFYGLFSCFCGKKVSTYTLKKRCTLKEKLKNIPKTVVFHKLTDEEKICRECGEEMTVIGYDSFIQVEYIPAHLEVQEHRKEKAVCRKCSKKDENGIFAVAKAPSCYVRQWIIS